MPFYRCDDDDDFSDDSGDDGLGDQDGGEDQDQDDDDDDDGENLTGEDEDRETDDDQNLIPDTALEEDYEEDEGDWTAEDYQESAERLFGSNEYFGETLTDQLAGEGYVPFEEPAFQDAIERVAPGASDTMRLYERDGRLHAFGFVPLALAALLRQQYGAVDFSNMHLSVPRKGELAEPQPLPPDYAAVEPKLAVDLRPHCTPVGDQADTSRCSAFAWTHALELTRNLENRPAPRLSATYTMLRFQRMQGDAQDYSYAHEGGSGTVSGPEPGLVLRERGTCRQELWPDDEAGPRASERMLAGDAEQFRLEAQPHPVSLEDAKRVLSAGCPIHLGMNTGPGFTEVGRDGIIPAAEAPSGRHGRHAMLLVGYNGNFFTAKNSWSEKWGDQGYCYIPKSVLAQADAELIAVLRPMQPAGARGTGGK